MRQPMHAARPDRGKRGLDVEPRGRQQRFPQRAGAEGRGGVPRQPRAFDDPAHQRIAVGMDPVRGQPQQHIARDHARRQRRAAVHRADGETREVEVARRIHPRHLGRLAADQRAARELAAMGDTLDDAGGGIDLQLAGREIVEEEQGFRPLTHQIIDAHGDKVDPDRVVKPCIDRDLELGAHAIGRGDKDRIVIASRLEVEERAEAAKPRHHARPRRGGGSWLDPVDQRIARVDVDARLGIGEAGFGVGHRAGLLRGICACP